MAKLEVEISAIDRLSANVANINRNLNGFVNNAQHKFDILTKGFAALGAASGIYAVVNGMKNLIQTGINYGDTVTDMARRTGLTTDKVQELSYIAKQSGTSIESLSMAFKKTAIGAYDNNKAFGLLNINVKNADGTLKETGTLFDEVLIKLADVKGNTERAAIAQKLFGKGGMEVNGIVSEGSDRIRELIAQTKEYGLILDKETIIKLHDAKEAQELMKTAITVLSAELSAMFVPSITQATLALAKFLSTINDNGKKSRETLLEEYTLQMNELDEAIKNAGTDGGLFVGGMFKTLAQGKRDLESIKKKITELRNDPSSGGGGSGGNSGGGKAIDVDKLLKDAHLDRIKWEMGVDANFNSERLKAEREIDAKLYKEQVDYVDGINKLFESLGTEMESSNAQAVDNMMSDQDRFFDYLQEQAERQTALYVSLGANLGRALGEGIASGDMGKALKGMAVEMLSFIEDLMLEAIAANTLKNILASPPGLWWVGALKGATEAVPIAAIFEGLKASISKGMASGGVSSGGFYMAGEHGPEPVYLPDKSRVISNMQTRQDNRSYGGNTMTIHLHDQSGNIVETFHRELRRGGSGDKLVTYLGDRIAAR